MFFAKVSLVLLPNLHLSQVILRCGTENKLLAASEPERCTYEFEFETPALCTIKTDPQTGETDNHDEL